MTVATDWLQDHLKTLEERRHEKWEYQLVDSEWQVSCMCGYWYTIVKDKQDMASAYYAHIEYQRFEIHVAKMMLESVKHTVFN